MYKYNSDTNVNLKMPFHSAFVQLYFIKLLTPNLKSPNAPVHINPYESPSNAYCSVMQCPLPGPCLSYEVLTVSTRLPKNFIY